MSLKKAWRMPAPAPCANTRIACARAARCSSPGTRVESSTSMLSSSESDRLTRSVCAPTSRAANLRLLHFRRLGVVVLAASLGALLSLCEICLFVRPHMRALADLLLALRRVHERLLSLVEFRSRLGLSLAVIGALVFHRRAPRFVDNLDITFPRYAAHCEGFCAPSVVGDVRLPAVV